MMIKEFFINFCILCTVIFIFHAYAHTPKFLKLNPLKIKTLTGGLNGGFGVILMQFGIHFGDGVLIDLRSIPIMISAIVGGWTASFITTLVLIAARLLMYPITYSSLVNIVVLLLSAVAFSFIGSSRMSRKQKWAGMCTAFIVIIGLFTHVVIPNWHLSLIIFSQYSIAVLVGTVAAFGITDYLWRNRKNYELLQEYAQKDHLTGLLNHRAYQEFLNESLNSDKDFKLVSLLAIDIDYFKSINDTYGHPAGDEILKQVSMILINSCRIGDKVFRCGGEEFAVVMPDCPLHTARKLAMRIQKKVEQYTFIINQTTQIPLTVSIGYAAATHADEASSKELIKQADEGLYLAKRSGRNQVRHFVGSFSGI